MIKKILMVTLLAVGSVVSLQAHTAQASALMPVLRLYDPDPIYSRYAGQHLLTIDQNESNVLTTPVLLGGKNYFWSSETSTFEAYAPTGGSCTTAGTEPIYRMYNSFDGDHMLTADQNEITYWTVTNHTSWSNEGIAFCAYATQVGGTVPVYRILRSDGNEHFLTGAQSEYQALAGAWGTSEGVAFFANP